MSGPLTDTDRCVLVLGAGINGCAVARELLINRVPVCLVDAADVAAGATSRSSRLIHGGLRYLEYGDVRLVRESLAERERLLALAPQFVRPLPLNIPVRRRGGGWAQAAFRFLRLSRFPFGRRLESMLPRGTERGLFVARAGLWMYDRLAKSDRLPGHSVRRVDREHPPRVDPHKYSWVCRYFDAQMRFPERFTLALLSDAAAIARAQGVPLEVFTYHYAMREGRRIVIHPAGDASAAVRELAPAAIINATGAAGDLTLRQLDVPSRRLFGGTRGSHILTAQPALKQALGTEAVYAEASDGRLIFVLPFGDQVLIGTTDVRFEGPPQEAVASEEEQRYLIEMVNEVFPGVNLAPQDVFAHYSGVRPLPYVPEGRTGSITRDHGIHRDETEGRPLLTLIGGKLTTCRAFAEEVTDLVLNTLALSRSHSTRARPVPGSENFPADQQAWRADLARRTGFTGAQLAALWPLIGTRAAEILEAAAAGDRSSIPGTDIPTAFVDWSIENEWVTCLGDLLERRLMLVLQPGLARATLVALADRLVQAGRLDAADRDAAVEVCAENLRKHYGITPQT